MRPLILPVVLSLLCIFGCRYKTSNGDPVSPSVRRNAAEIVNAFGMKFVRIEIDQNINVESDPPFPTETYYVQKDRISSEHLNRFRAFVKNRNIEPKPNEDYLMSSPCEWRDYSNLAALMSEYDPDYDYRLPTRSEWVFACMSGYEQRCIKELKDGDKPNAYGIVGMLDHNVECVSQVGLLMGNWINSWPGIYTGHEKPTCACKCWTMCNPDADDGLNEMIYGRFVLVQKKSKNTE